MKTLYVTLLNQLQMTLKAIFITLFVGTGIVIADDNKQNINNDWAYLAHNTNSVELATEAKNWQPINLPHTWNANDTVDAKPGYRRDASWYKKSLPISNATRHFLYFEGANMETHIYVNGKLAGSNIGGYIGFKVEITDYVKKDEDANIMVRVTNEYNPNLIPSQKSDFFIFGGITRDVWLLTSDKLAVDNLIVDLTNVSEKLGAATVTLNLNGLEAINNATVQTTLIAPNDNLVFNQTNRFNITQGLSSHSYSLQNIADPKLWSIDSPHLYTLQVSLMDENKSVIASRSTQFGYRWFDFKQGEGFFLNGKRVLLRGTHRHEEHAGLGAALSNEQHFADMKQIKDVGVNFVRLGHYPQDPAVYQAADELGLILWDELPWCRGGKGGEVWEQNTESLLTRQMLQNRNHPSIAFWSIGNEMYWEADFPGGGEESVVTPYVQKLNDMIKASDPTRFTTIRKYYPASDIVDIFSPSIWAGWYGGAYGQYETAIIESTKKHPTLIHMEYGGSSHVGRHEENPVDETGLKDAQVSVTEAMNQAVVKSVAKDSNWNENYMVNLFDWHLSVSERLPGFIGNAQWAFKDFGTPLRPENPIPYVNQKGLVDRSGQPKDAYYVFASYWSSEPFCYIESKTWTVRYGPKSGRKVKVYCNTETAELSLNGKSLGEKTRHYGQYPAHGLVWDVPFVAGKNTLSVVGRAKNVKVTDQTHVTYHVGTVGKPKQVDLTYVQLENDIFKVTAKILDNEGKQVTTYEDRGYFSALDANSILIEDQGTPIGTSSIELADGVANILVKKLSSSPAVIEFKTQNFKGNYLILGSNN
jgi:beta-galactosidase